MWHRIEQLIVWLFAVVFVGVALHTPMSVFIESRWPEFELLAKSWKELVLGLIAALLALSVWRRKLLLDVVFDKFVILAACIALVHLILVAVFDNAYVSEMAGLLIDLRFYLFFVELYVAARYLKDVRRTAIGAAAVGAGIVVVFGVLQVSLLPRDVLSHIGYSSETIRPYLTVDLNYDYVRINSTLRGPNPVGAFAVIVLGLLAAWFVRRRQVLSGWQDSGVLVMALVGVMTILVASYSRSAWLAAALVMLLVGCVMLPKRYLLRGVVATMFVGVVAVSGLFILRDNPVISNLFFHNNPESSSVTKSDDGHAESLQHGIMAAGRAPEGHGVGSTGSASLHGDNPVIIENQYLFMAHESGWLGLVLQLWLFVLVMAGLWRGRQDWLALGLFVSGVGLALIGVLLPVWADDTVSLYWWGLAGLALGSSAIIRTNDRTATTSSRYQKAKRTA